MKDMIDFVILIILYFALFYKKWKVKGKDVLLVNTTMYIYLSFVLYFTLMPIVTSIPFVFNHQYTPMNLVAFLLSLSIEILQPLINGFRASDITDIITNVIGGIIGYIMYFIFKPLTNKILNCIKNK